MDTTPTTPSTPCPKCAPLFAQLATKVERLEKRIIELETRLQQNSSNSSKPPSSDPPFQKPSSTRPKSDRKPGGQPGHMGCTRKPLAPEAITDIQILLPLKCGACGHRLPKKPGKMDPAMKHHQVIEIPPMTPEVTEYQIHGRCCSSCGKITWGILPEGIHGCFGPRLTAWVAYLSGRFHMSKRNIQEALEAIMGVHISLGSVSLKEVEVSQALGLAWEEALQEVRKAPVKNADETGWFLSGKLKWLWAAVSAKASVFLIQDRRNQKAMKRLLGEKVQGFVGSDRFGAYTPIPNGQRQLCWAHLIRDLQGLVDGGTKPGVQTGKAGLRLSRKVFKRWGQFQEGKMGRKRLMAHMEGLNKRMEKILRRGREGPDKKTARFCGRVLKLQEALWTFAREEGVEPTNNAAERAVRPAVLWRKSSYGNRSESGCRFVERILTAVQTLRLQNRNVLDYLTLAVEASRLRRPCLSLVG